MLSGKCGVVTGAGSGIGAATAMHWASNGAKVVCADIDLASVEEVVREINETFPNSAVAIKADVSRVDDTIRMLDLCVNRFGNVHIFFANAGILPKNNPLKEQREDEFLKVLEVNLLGPFLAIKHGSKYMMKHNGSDRKCSIICTGSIAAIRADLTPLAYTASKGGVLSMVQSANDQLQMEGIRVNAVIPGGVNTKIYWAMAKALDEEGLELKGYDYKKFPPIEPEEIAEIVTFLASDRASAIKGQVVVADGGMSQSMGSQPYPTKKRKKKARL